MLCTLICTHSSEKTNNCTAKWDTSIVTFMYNTYIVHCLISQSVQYLISCVSTPCEVQLISWYLSLSTACGTQARPQQLSVHELSVTIQLPEKVAISLLHHSLDNN